MKDQSIKPIETGDREPALPLRLCRKNKLAIVNHKGFHVATANNAEVAQLIIDYVNSAAGYDESASLQQRVKELEDCLRMMTALCRLKYGNLEPDVYEEILKAESLLTPKP